MKEQLIKLRQVLKEERIDAFLSSEPLIRRYLSGFTGTAGYAVVSQDRLDFCTDFRYFEQMQLECPDYELVKLSKDYTLVDYLRDQGFRRVAVEETFITLQLCDQIRRALPDVELVYGFQMVNSIRMIKFADEIQLHKESCEITNRIVEEFFQYVRPGMTEIQLNEFILAAVRRHGADNCFFDPITLTGPNTSLNHGKPSNRQVQVGDFILLDMGVNYKGYASDVTRTAVMGPASDKQKEIYNLVLSAHKTAAAGIRAGMTCFEADKLARDVIEAAGYGQNFGHALGHGFHDGLVLRNNDECAKMTMKENMVFTIEPGVYLPGWGGVRIEDDYVLTADGCRSFCTYTKELQELPC